LFEHSVFDGLNFFCGCLLISFRIDWYSLLVLTARSFSLLLTIISAIDLGFGFQLTIGFFQIVKCRFFLQVTWAFHASATDMIQRGSLATQRIELPAGN
jgi:hypothetical protein